jgi:hypothetical protein
MSTLSRVVVARVDEDFKMQQESSGNSRTQTSTSKCTFDPLLVQFSGDLVNLHNLSLSKLQSNVKATPINPKILATSITSH